jgi:hypothetical protein
MWLRSVGINNTIVNTIYDTVAHVKSKTSDIDRTTERDSNLEYYNYSNQIQRNRISPPQSQTAAAGHDVKLLVVKTYRASGPVLCVLNKKKQSVSLRSIVDSNSYHKDGEARHFPEVTVHVWCIYEVSFLKV